LFFFLFFFFFNTRIAAQRDKREWACKL